jgi:hypothetical protein
MFLFLMFFTGLSSRAAADVRARAGAPSGTFEARPRAPVRRRFFNRPRFSLRLLFRAPLLHRPRGGLGPHRRRGGGALNPPRGRRGDPLRRGRAVSKFSAHFWLARGSKWLQRRDVRPPNYRAAPAAPIGGGESARLLLTVDLSRSV